MQSLLSRACGRCGRALADQAVQAVVAHALLPRAPQTQAIRTNPLVPATVRPRLEALWASPQVARLRQTLQAQEEYFDSDGEEYLYD